MHAQQVPHETLGDTTTRSPSLTGCPSKSVTGPPSARIRPTFSCPWMSGKRIVRGVVLPPYCSVQPCQVCLSVPQMPERVMATIAPPRGGSGMGYSRVS